MEWILASVALLVGAYLLVNLGFKMGRKSLEPIIKQAALDQATDRHHLLSTWRRELANILVWRDPTRHVRFYDTLHSQLSDISKWTPEARAKEYRRLCEAYPLYGTFEPLGTRPHVLYADASSSEGQDQLEQKFRDIALFEALLIASSPEWSRFQSTTGNDLEHLKAYAPRIIDTKFRLRLERTIQEYYLAHNPLEKAWDTDLVRVCGVSHFAENRYGVHFKDTNEYGLFCSFHHDNGQTFERYLRSDREFQSEGTLRPISEVLTDYRSIFQGPPDTNIWR